MADETLLRLAERLQGVCLARRLTVATAESCTGGLVGDVLTDVPGSSGYFLGGVVSYSDRAKRELLDVPVELLEKHGAVSAQVARAMALGARSRLHAAVGLSVTGIAGPDGGSDAKPVGLTYVGVADADGADVRRVVWTGSRIENKAASAAAVLELVLERLGGASESASGDEPEPSSVDPGGGADETPRSRAP